MSDYLEAFSRIAEELVECSRLTLLDGELVQDAVGRDGRRGRVHAALRQQVLGVQHLRHRDAVAEALVQGSQH